MPGIDPHAPLLAIRLSGWDTGQTMLVHPAVAFPSISFDMNGPAAPLTGGWSAHHKPSLLLAKDETSTREFLHEILLPHYEVTVVLDGAQAIDAARRAPPDLVLSNVVMPGVDGIGLVRWLRANTPTATVPIILLSADNQTDTLRRGLEARARMISCSSRSALAKSSPAWTLESDLPPGAYRHPARRSPPRFAGRVTHKTGAFRLVPRCCAHPYKGGCFKVPSW